MSVSYLVRYAGHDPGESFVRRYREVHVPILLDFPGIRSVVLRTPVVAAEPFATRSAGTHLLAEMRFDDLAALDAALASPARARAREDFAAMPPFSGAITHEAMAAEIFWP